MGFIRMSIFLAAQYNCVRTIKILVIIKIIAVVRKHKKDVLLGENIETLVIERISFTFLAAALFIS